MLNLDSNSLLFSYSLKANQYGRLLVHCVIYPLPPPPFIKQNVFIQLNLKPCLLQYTSMHIMYVDRIIEDNICIPI